MTTISSFMLRSSPELLGLHMMLTGCSRCTRARAFPLAHAAPLNFSSGRKISLKVSNNPYNAINKGWGGGCVVCVEKPLQLNQPIVSKKLMPKHFSLPKGNLSPAILGHVVHA